MSYSISVKAENGQAEVTGISGDVPDGTWSIAGHKAPPIQVTGGATMADTSIQVTQNDATGRKVIGAQHYDQVVT